MRLFCIYVVLCVGSGLVTGWSPIQGILPTMYRLRSWKSGRDQKSSTSCKAIERERERERECLGLNGLYCLWLCNQGKNTAFNLGNMDLLLHGGQRLLITG
jgi:hypothetical protein